MKALDWLTTLPTDVWQRLFFPSVMMAVLGICMMLLLRSVSVQSWKLRSWLVAAVLLQGLMFVRAPLELAWLPPVSHSESVFVGDWASIEPNADANPSNESNPTDNSPTGELTGELTGGRAMEAVVPFASLPNNSWSELSWQPLAGSIWLLVTTTIIVHAVIRYFRLRRTIARLDSAPQDWQNEWRTIRGNDRSNEMLVSQTVGPMLFRRPTGYVLVVPQGYWQSLDETKRRSVMLHELAHLERRDVWRQLFAHCVAALHWFNPFAWWALRQYESASEVACDQRVAEQGPREAAGFAAALLDLVQWREERSVAHQTVRGLGMQFMAAPPLSDRVTRLIQNNENGESMMKKLSLTLVAVTLVAVSCFQIQFIPAQEVQESQGVQEDQSSDLRVIDDETADRLQAVIDALSPSDTTAARLQDLSATPSGRIALAGYLDSLVGQSMERARLDAVPRFLDHHFEKNEDGKLIARDVETTNGWVRQSKRLADDMSNMQSTMIEMAKVMDTSTEAGGLFKRLLNDPQASAAVMINEMDGNDIVTRYLSEALGRLLVQRADGGFQVVESRRTQAEQQIERLTTAEKLRDRLRMELPNLADEYVDNDERHQKLNEYLNKPAIASLVAVEMSEDTQNIPLAVEKLYQHFEEASRDTPEGLKFTNDEAWSQMEEIFERVDRAERILPRLQERLVEYAERMTSDDPLSQQLAENMRQEPLAVALSAELPYADANPGSALKALLSEVMTKQEGVWKIKSEREEEVGQRARELLQTCRRMRRYSNGIERLLTDVADQEMVKQLGEAGRYVILNEVRRFAAQHRSDPIELLKSDLLEQDGERWSVREERREVVRELVAQAERVRAESANDDF
ncbi:MAG: M56 family metallopeptidase [Planctomycetota bacterium]